MRVGELTAWPPVPGHGRGSASAHTGEFLGCRLVIRTDRQPAHLLVSMRGGDIEYTAAYWHPSENILRRLEATLRHCAGWPMAQTKGLPLVGPAERVGDSSVA